MGIYFSIQALLQALNKNRSLRCRLLGPLQKSLQVLALGITCASFWIRILKFVPSVPTTTWSLVFITITPMLIFLFVMLQKHQRWKQRIAPTAAVARKENRVVKMENMSVCEFATSKRDEELNGFNWKHYYMPHQFPPLITIDEDNFALLCDFKEDGNACVSPWNFFLFRRQGWRDM